MSWDKSSSPILTRTDDSATFGDPNPYYSGMSGDPSSPFDNLMPWSGMVIETVDNNVMVKIPKFYYKITNTSNQLKFQISNLPQTGFKISPAHRSQNENDTEKDYIYVGRYKCDASYGSTTGSTPKGNITIGAARNGCRALGQNYEQMDFATWWTIRMLYIVEFANWNCQSCIGRGGRSSANSPTTTGYTDSLTYHTGTTQTSRDSTTNFGIQYRWIEGLWENCLEFIDGIVFNSKGVYTFNDRANYSNSYTATGAIRVGTRPSTGNGNITDFFVPSTTSQVDYDIDWMMYPSAVGGLDGSTYVCDSCSTDTADGEILYGGGSYNPSTQYGLFQLNGGSLQSGKGTGMGARLIYYP